MSNDNTSTILKRYGVFMTLSDIENSMNMISDKIEDNTFIYAMNKDEVVKMFYDKDYFIPVFHRFIDKILLSVSAEWELLKTITRTNRIFLFVPKSAKGSDYQEYTFQPTIIRTEFTDDKQKIIISGTNVYREDDDPLYSGIILDKDRLSDYLHQLKDLSNDVGISVDHFARKYPSMFQFIILYAGLAYIENQAKKRDGIMLEKYIELDKQIEEKYGIGKMTIVSMNFIELNFRKNKQSGTRKHIQNAS